MHKASALAKCLLIFLCVIFAVSCGTVVEPEIYEADDCVDISLADNPTEEYIISCLKQTPNVVDIAPATKDHDPNEGLGKDGGYYSAVYFSVDAINQDDVYGDDLIEKGTDAGGCIEAYKTVEDATARSEDLGKYDGTLLTGGYRAQVGTLLVRTSKELSEDDHDILEQNIISILTGGEASGAIEVETTAPETTAEPIETTTTPAPETTKVTTTAVTTTEATTIATTVATTTEATTSVPIIIPEVPSTFSIHFIDVGQADAALVECDGKYMLIDGGNKNDSSLMYSLLKNSQITNLDIVVATHAHEDHIGGLAGALNYAKSALTLCPTSSYDSEPFWDFKKYADKNGGGIIVPSIGDTYELGSATIEILGVNGGSEVNDTSIVLMIEYGDTRFLFTGDAERDAEQSILNRNANLSCDLLKVGHHGSKDSTTYPFLREIMPTYAVISVGDDNTYGHPTDDALSRLKDADVKVYRTDLHGDVYVTSDGKKLTITTERNASNDDIFKGADIYVPPVVVAPVVTTAEEVKQEEPIGTDYIYNKNTKKFHYTYCNSVKQMKDKNKGYFTGTRDEMISRGYSPCKNCNP